MFDKIYNIDDTVLVSFDGKELDFNGTPQHVEELMKSDYITVQWNDIAYRILPAGAYIIYRGTKYLLLEPYEPERKSECHFQYEPQFQHPVMWLDKIPFYHLQGDTSSIDTATPKSSWNYTGNISTIAGRVVECINYLANTYAAFGDVLGNSWTAAVATDIQSVTSSITLTFDGTSIFSACSQIASSFDCEFHFDWENKVLMFAKTIAYGTAISLKVGENISVPSITKNKKDYYNSYIVRGGTRNISQPSVSGDNVQVTERLTLDETTFPNSIAYTDGNGNIITRDEFAASNKPLLLKELDFDDIFPHLTLYVYNPRERKCWLLDENDNKIEDPDGELDEDGKRYKSYSKWYIRLAYPIKDADDKITEWKDYLISEDLLIKDQTLTIDFFANNDSTTYSSPLAGRSFEMTYFFERTTEKMIDDIDPKGFTAEEGDYRIIFEDGDLIIPTTSKQGLVPKGGVEPSTENNMCTLVGIVVDNTYLVQARADLLIKAKEEIERLQSDLNSYTVKSLAHVFATDSKYQNLHIGQLVNYDDGQDENGGTAYQLNARIQKLTTNLDFEEEIELTLGNAVIKGNNTILKEQVENLVIATSGIGGTSMTEAQFNQLVANYGKMHFLSKSSDDTANGVITFHRGLESESAALFGDNAQSANLLTGFAGYGWLIDALGNAELDSLTVRKSMRVFELLIQQVRASAGEIVVSPANGRVKSVTYVPKDTHDNDHAYYVVTVESDDVDGQFGNMFQVGDFVRCQRWDKSLNTYKYYWARVSWVGGNSMSLPAYYFQDDSGAIPYAPTEGDELVLYGSMNSGRQAVITISAASRTPKITILNGITGTKDTRHGYTDYFPSEDGCARVVLGGLSGISDEYFSGDNKPSGYGLYSDNVFLKGKLALSNGTLISDELTNIKSGEITLSADKTTVDSDLYVNNVETIPDTSTNPDNKARVKISGSLMEVFNEYNKLNIRLGVDGNGYSILQYLDNEGNVLYDLGPNGLQYSEAQDARFEKFIYSFLDSDTTASKHDHSGTAATLYLYYAKKNVGIIQADSDGSGSITADLAKKANGKWFLRNAYASIVSNDALTNLVTGLYEAANAEPKVYSNLRKYDTVDELKQAITDEWGITDFSGIDFTLKDEEELVKPIYVQEFIIFNNGVRSTRNDIWQ